MSYKEAVELGLIYAGETKYPKVVNEVFELFTCSEFAKNVFKNPDPENYSVEDLNKIMMAVVKKISGVTDEDKLKSLAGAVLMACANNAHEGTN